MNSKYLFYFCEGIGSVFDSQVLTLLNAINEEKFFTKVYLFLGIRNEVQKNYLSVGKVSPDIQIVFFKSYPNYPFFTYLNRISISTALFNHIVDFKEVIFHTRGEIIAWHLTEILNEKYYKQIIPDVRGASVEEVEEYFNLNNILKLLKTSNIKKSIKNLRSFRKISVVSDSLKEHLVTNYEIDQQKIAVTPCLSGKKFHLDVREREQIRNELKLNNEDVLIVYSSGGTAEWQNDSMLTILAEKGLKVLNLSRNKIPHTNILNKFVDYSEVPGHLNAADIAIIWRDKSVVNKVASPVKFSEFICCGLPVIANDSVNMISEYLDKNHCGVLIDRIENLEMNSIKELKHKDRKEISESGILNFGVDKIVRKYIQLYEEINEG